MWTYTVTYQNRTTGFAEMVPYVLALVELEEGVRMFTNIVDCNPRDVHIGMAVEVTFQTATPADYDTLLQTGGGSRTAQGQPEPKLRRLCCSGGVRYSTSHSPSGGGIRCRRCVPERVGRRALPSNSAKPLLDNYLAKVVDLYLVLAIVAVQIHNCGGCPL